jgi:MoaA/NifB/PqqE/SkfB family radical SAM enzyme
MSNTEVSVGSDGSLTLPPEVARAYGLVPGAKARLDVQENGFVVRRTPSHLARLYVELTNGCNIDCRTCMRNIWDLQTGFLSDELFEKIRSEIAGMEDRPVVFFGGFGEPMHHPKALEYIRRIRETGAEVDLITNGTLLTPERIEELIAVGLRRLWVSIDGARPESYSDVRLGASLPLVLRNLQRLQNRKLLLAKTRPEMGIAFVAMEQNIADLPEVVKIGLKLGAERFSISNVLAHDRRLKAQTLYDAEMAKWNAKRPTVELPRIDFENPQVTEALRGVMDAGSRALGTPELGLFPPADRCPFIEKGSMSIRWDGEVAPCLALLHTHTHYIDDISRTSHAYTVGSIAEQSVVEIWNDPDYLDFRERLDAFDFSPCTTCRSCEQIEQNLSDCSGNQEPACGGCLWAQGFIRCP